ncbi:MAG: fatty acid desaturase [Gammaproteobacteria bacterium]|nr:fatty acid desaturase [Gammaproteobacteria bacterium]
MNNIKVDKSDQSQSKIVNDNSFLGRVDNVNEVNVRDSMLVLPAIFQPFLTWLTAKSASNEAYKHRGRNYQIITTFLSIAIGLIASIFMLKQAGYFLLFLPLSLIVTTSGLRKLQVVLFHNCVHGLVFNKTYKNYLFGEFISIVMMLKNYLSYKKEHLAHHSSKKLLTFEDDTIQFLFNFIGFAPGMKRSRLWIVLYLSLISPFSHLRGIFSRITVCFFSHSTIHNVIAIGYWAVLIYTISHFNLWNYFVVAWLLPLFILNQISTTLRLIVEHKWPNQEIMNSRGKEFICLSTSAVFLGEKVPNSSGSYKKKVVAWSCWILKMIFIHLFSRVFVMVGDTPCHDFHHRRPSTRRWYNYISERQLDEKNGCPGFPMNYSESWGLFTAINNNFECLSRMSTR